MSQFQVYLQLGFEHILDMQGYDHILFIVALCAVYRANQWRQVLILVTAFTLGHSLTLALAALKIVSFQPKIIEFLIPLTILFTAIYHVLQKENSRKNIKINYLFALFFGLIHGLGFSNYFRALLGQEESIVQPLLAFNIGVELGQIIIVVIVMLIAYIAMSILRVRQRDWVLFVSGAAAGISLVLLVSSF